MTAEQEPIFFSEGVSNPLLTIGATKIAESVAASISTGNSSELTEEDFLCILGEGRRQVRKAFDINSDITNADILGAARANLAIEESDLNRTTVEWLERITETPSDES